MKNILLLSAAVCMMLSACKKETQEAARPLNDKAKKYAVKFNVKDFQQTVEKISAVKGASKTAAEPLAGRVNYLYYMVYDSSGTEVSRRWQDSTGNTLKYLIPNTEAYIEPLGNRPFGDITDSLTAGTYTIVFAASQKMISINSHSEEGLGVVFYNPLNEASFYYERGLNSWSRAGDTFFKKLTLTVKSEDCDTSVSLNRIVGKIRIHLKDALPANADHFEFQFLNENEAYKFSTEQPFGNTTDDEFHFPVLINNSQKGQPDYTYEKYIINTATPLNVVIMCYDASNNLIASKTVNDVRCYKNKITVLSGKLFNSSGGTPETFAVSVNSEWDEETVDVPF